jgi:pyruvate-ferredoxin/flavodoxin oxidoreductase
MPTNKDSGVKPGIAAVVDGSETIASVEPRISEIACAYPITPSTTMAARSQAAVADGTPNLWGTPLRFIELESEHSSASSAEGGALAGACVTNFTADQAIVPVPRHELAVLEVGP